MRVRATLRFILVIGALCIATAIPAARAQQTPPNVNPTHYWTYHLNQPYPNGPNDYLERIEANIECLKKKLEAEKMQAA